jgi:hypothetical protein
MNLHLLRKLISQIYRPSHIYLTLKQVSEWLTLFCEELNCTIKENGSKLKWSTDATDRKKSIQQPKRSCITHTDDKGVTKLHKTVLDLYLHIQEVCHEAYGSKIVPYELWNGEDWGSIKVAGNFLTSKTANNFSWRTLPWGYGILWYPKVHYCLHMNPPMDSSELVESSQYLFC